MSAKVKLLSYIGTLFVFAILITSIIGYLNFKSASVEGATEQLKLETLLVSNALDQRIQRYFDSLETISSELPIYKDGTIDVDLAKIKFAEITKKLNVINTYAGLKNGETYTPKGILKGFNAKKLKREWFTRIFSGEKRIITKPYTAKTGAFVMALSIPIIRDKEIVSTLNINIPVNSITRFVENLSDGDQIFVSRSDGFILAANEEDIIGKNLFELYPSYEAYKDKEVASQHIYQHEGDEYIVNSIKIPSLGWNVWVWDKTSNISAASNANLIFTSSISFLLILITLVLIYLAVVKLMYIPIGGEPKEIEALVKRVADGDFTLQARVSGKETGIYAAMIIMIDNLKEIIGNINNATERLKSSSNNVETSAVQVFTSSEQQMQQLENTSTAMNEMTMTVEEVAKNALQASTAVHEATQFSEQGSKTVQEMNDNISTLVAGIEKVIVVTNELENETQGIGSILEVINAVSEQTNLLALNAAIEAARAGEHGRGFAVVADEVRNLANRTKESTDEIQNMINKLQSGAQRSVQLMDSNMRDVKATAEKSDSANQALQSIRESVVVIQNMNDQIATAAEEQTHVASEINVSIVAINDLAKGTYETTDSNKKMAADLIDVASQLDKSVEVFKL